MAMTTLALAPETSQSGALQDRLAELRAAHGTKPAEAFLEAMLKDEFAGRIAAVSSFGSESVVLLHLISQVDPATPVSFSIPASCLGKR